MARLCKLIRAFIVLNAGLALRFIVLNAGLAVLFLIIFADLNLANAETLRIISLYPGHTDNVIALGGGDMLVGISENDDKDILVNLPRFSPRDGAEKMLALRPDIVLTRRLAERLNPTLSDVLRRAGVQVYSIDTPKWDNFPDYLRKLAEILRLNSEDGVKKLDDLKNKISQAALSAQKKGMKAPKVFVEATSRELHTCAPDSWAAHLIELAGGVNAAHDAEPLRKGSAIAPFGLEKILRLLSSSTLRHISTQCVSMSKDGLNSGIDVYIIQNGAMNAATVEDVKARPWAAAFNFNNNSSESQTSCNHIKIVEIPESILSRPSLSGLERGGRELLKIFYDIDIGDIK